MRKSFALHAACRRPGRRAHKQGQCSKTVRKLLNAPCSGEAGAETGRDYEPCYLDYNADLSLPRGPGH
eukprot:2043455-Pyramimonas_sp.AAC.1